MGRVLDLIRSRLCLIFKSEPPIPVRFLRDSLGGDDSLYIFELDHHAYAALHFANLGLCIIADGEKLFLKDSKIASRIDRKLRTQTRGLEYKGSYHQDTCGGGAACIGYELLRLYNSESRPPTEWSPAICVSPSIHRGIMRDYRGKDLVALPEATTNIDMFNTSVLTCQICGWKAPSRKKSALAMHNMRNHQ